MPYLDKTRVQALEYHPTLAYWGPNDPNPDASLAIMQKYSPGSKKLKVKFTRPELWMVIGKKGSGKSSLVERIGEFYIDAGASILDLSGASDSEGLAWLRSPYKNLKILLLTGNFQSPYDGVMNFNIA